MPKKLNVYYFLGAELTHLEHALPLYRRLGGTFVVTTKAAEYELQKQDLKVIRKSNVNVNLRRKADRFRERLSITPKRFILGREVRETFGFLEQNADVVLFYELYEFTKFSRLNWPKTIFLTHGNMLKDYMGMYSRRIKLMEAYDYMAGLSPYLKKKHVGLGIPVEKILDIGIARNDEMTKGYSQASSAASAANKLGVSEERPIVAYLPTYWGPSSIHTLGKAIIENFPTDKTLVFRPHPQTPQSILSSYQELIRKSLNKNIVYSSATTESLGVTLSELLRASSAVIVDVSSVVLDAVLLEKPILFAYDQDSLQSESSYEMIVEIAESSQSVTTSSVKDLPSLIDNAIENRVSKDIYNKVLERAFYGYRGDAVDGIIATLESISSEQRK